MEEQRLHTSCHHLFLGSSVVERSAVDGDRLKRTTVKDNRLVAGSIPAPGASSTAMCSASYGVVWFCQTAPAAL